MASLLQNCNVYYRLFSSKQVS